LEPFHESGAYLGIFRRDDPLTQKIHCGDIVKLREADTEAYLRFLETVGDGRYVASPRVDSYHGIWFELHEDLIQLAGRTRADEVAAGRA